MSQYRSVFPDLVPFLTSREDLAYRLPEMEQPGSDQENLDSENSLSSESLLDEQQRSSAHSSEPEGQCERAAWPLPPATCLSHLWDSDQTTGPLGLALPVFCGAGLDQ